MKLKAIVISCLLIISMIGCKKEQKPISPENLYKFREYIAEVTTGIISTKSDFKVVLMNPVPEWKNGIELDGDILKITPKVKGKVIALNNRTVSFVPEERLKQDTRYTLALKLGDIQDVPKDYRLFEFDAKTIKQEVAITTNHLQSYSKDWQYLEIFLKSSDELSLETAKKIVTASQKGKNLKIKSEQEAGDGQYFSFVIDSIQRFVKDSEIDIEWNGNDFGIDSKGDFSFEIPGKNNFSVVNVSAFDDKAPYIEVNFSDPIKKDQNFHGLVDLEKTTYLTFRTEGNVLFVYPTNFQKGEKKLTINRGIKSKEGYKTKKNFYKDISFEDLMPEVRLLQSGTILPTSQDLKFNFEAVGLKAVDITVIKIFEDNVLQFLQANELNGDSELKRVARPVAKKMINLEERSSNNLNDWNAYAVDLKTIIDPNPGAIYRVEVSFKKAYSLFKCEDAEEDLIAEQSTDYDNEEESSYWDSSSYYYNDYNYNWSERDNPCHSSYYRDKSVSANILASNLGVTVKKGLNGSYFVAVNDILTTSPISGAEVGFYNFQQQLIAKQKTDSEGYASIDSDKTAYFAIVRKDKQASYVKLKDGNALSVSKFDVSGTQLKKGLKGYIYGERGVWRPGDSIYVSFMLNDKVNPLPKGHPVKFEFFDPYGTLTHREVKTGGLNNFYNFIVATDEEDPTGNWNAKIRVGGAEFSQKIKIETIKPNRLKIKAGLEKEWINHFQSVNGNLNVTWLHGAIAKNLKADINVKLSPQKTTFKNYPGYEFDDPTRSFSGEEQQVFKGAVDENGNATFKFKPSINSSSPGMLKATFITKAYENGGDFSTDVFSSKYSPYGSYVGLITPKGDAARNMLLTDKKHRFDVVTVNEKGNPVAIKNLDVKIYKIDYNWWWTASESNLSSFNSNYYQDEVFNTKVTTNSKGQGTFEFELKYPEWGRYLVRVVNRESGHATGKTIFIDWPGWAGKAKKGDPSAATMLSFSTDKKAYQVGEKAIVTFPSSSSGRALVTVENGSRVIQSQWVKAKRGDTKFELPITKEMTPNVYIHISLFQPHNNTKNDLPIRMYGISAINVEDKVTKLEPNITMPNVLAPEQKFNLKVSEKNGKAMTYSIAIVDEGLLDLTRFKTPNPWHTFYAKEALGVKTWDIYDDIIGAFGGRINQVFSIGGDGMANAGKNKKANRFKPVVIYKGPFELKKGKSKTHEIELPKYIGSVRTMVVAHNPETESYGSSEKATPVRKPLMLLASVPRKVTPGEKIRVPVTVFAMEKSVKNVTVKIKPNNKFKVLGQTSQSLYFKNPDEKMAYFDLEVLENGIAKIEVEASGNGKKATYSLELNAHNPNPESTEKIDIALEPNSTQTITFDTFGVQGTNNAQLELSSLPAMDFNSRLNYLIKYPHGCVEQTTSSVFPQLYLTDIFDLSSEKKAEIQKNVQAGIDRLASFQLSNGAFSYWQGQAHADDWATSYVGHFLTEAEKKGYVLPLSFKSRWIQYQKGKAKKWRKTSYNNSLSQAYRLYSLAIAGSPDTASMNRLRESEDLSSEALLRLGAAYAAAGLQSVAKNILGTSNFIVQNINYDVINYGSTNRNRAMALESFVLVKDLEKAKPLGEELALALSSNKYMSTQTTSYALLAMSQYANILGGKGIQLNFTTNGKNKKNVSTSKTLASRELLIRKGNNKITLTNTKANTIYVRVLNNGILPVGEEKVAERNMSASMVFKNKNGTILDPKSISQGTDFVAEVIVKNKTGSMVRDIALSTIFPSGWEIVNTRFTDFGDFADNDAEYIDIRDDRSNFYFDLGSFKSKTFRVLLNASYLGSYYLPGTQCEAMYDDDYFVRNKGQWIEVTK